MNFEEFLKCMGECGYCPGLSFPQVVDLLERTGMNTRLVEVDVKNGEYYAKNVYFIRHIDKATAIRCLKSHLKHFGGLCAAEVFPVFEALLNGKTAKVIKCQR